MMSVCLIEGDHLRFTYRGTSGGWKHLEYQAPSEGGIISHVIATGRAYRSNDLSADPHTDADFDAVFGLHSQLTVPLIGADGHVLGGVTLYNKRDERGFTGHDVSLLGALTSQAATALERARSRGALAQTVDQLRRTHGELTEARRSVEQRTAELGAMVELSSAVAGGGDVDAVFNMLAGRAAEVANFDVVLLNTYDAATVMTTFRAIHHRLPRPPRELLARRGTSRPAAESIVFRGLARGGGPLVFRASDGRPTPIPGLDLVISVPLRFDETLVGALCFGTLREREVSTDELRLLDALGRQVALAVHSAQTVARIRQMRADAVFRLAAACEARDPETGAHLRQIQSLVNALARELSIPEPRVEELALAGVLHDVGKIVVPEAILWKPGPLGPEEFNIVKMHTTQGETMLAGPDFYATARDIARHHHERWDGAGYPDGRAATDIPFPARLVAVADVYDALISPRVYKHAWPEDEAAREILAGAGTHFDPRIVEAFEALWQRGALDGRTTAA
jgi:GAF domain-containing protein